MYNVLTEGIRALLSRKLIIFSIFLIGIALVTSIGTLYYSTLSVSNPTIESFLKLAFAAEAAVAISFVGTGIIGRWLKPTSARILVMLVILITFLA